MLLYCSTVSLIHALIEASILCKWIGIFRSLQRLLLTATVKTLFRKHLVIKQVRYGNKNLKINQRRAIQVKTKRRHIKFISED